MQVCGDKDADGFYRGECAGREGYIPCNMVSEVPVESSELKQQLLKQGFLPADTESPGTVCVCVCPAPVALGWNVGSSLCHMQPVQPPNSSGGLSLDLQPGLVAALQQEDLAGCGCSRLSVHP